MVIKNFVQKKGVKMKLKKAYILYYSSIVLASIFIVGCSTISVHEDYDPEYDFSKLKTFGFIPISSEAGIDQLSADKLGNAIKVELSAKGYTLSDKADFGIALMFSSKTKTNIQSYGYGYGYGYWGHPGMYGPGGGIDVTQYDEGTLVIDVIDMTEQKLVWRGIGSGPMSQSPTVEERTEKINKAVHEILAQFPPTKKQD
jgi:hypothetical protein